MAWPERLWQCLRMRRTALLLAAVWLAVGGLCRAVPANAQSVDRPEAGHDRPRYNLEEQPDVQANLRNYCRDRVPAGWWCEDPVKLDYAYKIVIHAPLGWQGDPYGAVLNFCPAVDDAVWKGLDLLELQPNWNNVLGALVTCRRE